MNAATDTLKFREVTPERWPDFERLSAGRGGPKHCWCMVFRAQGEETRHTDGVSRKAAMQRRISSSTPDGILAHLDGELVPGARSRQRRRSPASARTKTACGRSPASSLPVAFAASTSAIV